MREFKEYNLPFETVGELLDYVMQDVNFAQMYTRITNNNPNITINFAHPDLVMILTAEYMQPEDCPGLTNIQIENLKEFLCDLFSEVDKAETQKYGRIPSKNETEKHLQG